MTLPRDVQENVGWLDKRGRDDAWSSVRAHLMSQDAELKILRVKCSGTLANNLCPDHRDKQVGNPCLACTIEKLQSRLAAANALLRKVYAYLDRFDPNSDVYDEVEAHLQGSGDEATD